MYAPQLFQGINADVGVPAAPIVRESMSGASPRTSNARLNIRPGSTIAMYWSAVMTLVASTAATRDVTSAPTDFATRITGSMSSSRMPAFSTTPPNASAAMISQMVFSMLSMPPRETSVSIVWFPVVDLYPLANASQTPFSRRSGSEVPSPAPANAITRPGATMTASRPPASAPRKMAVNGGNLSRASTITTTSGTNSQSEMSKALWRAAIFSLASKSPGWPSSQKTSRDSASASPDVTAVSRMWSWRRTPAARGAGLAGSAGGGGVSPKEAPGVPPAPGPAR